LIEEFSSTLEFDNSLQDIAERILDWFRSPFQETIRTDPTIQKDPAFRLRFHIGGFKDKILPEVLISDIGRNQIRSVNANVSAPRLLGEYYNRKYPTDDSLFDPTGQSLGDYVDLVRRRMEEGIQFLSTRSDHPECGGGINIIVVTHNDLRWLEPRFSCTEAEAKLDLLR
jgi:hypothetical protein